MTNKSLFKIGIAFGLVAALLIFLGVSFVPRSTASSSTKLNGMETSKTTMPDTIDSHLAAVSQPVLNVSPDWVERRIVISNLMKNSSPDWVERHLPKVIESSDVSRPSYYDNSDWVERHSRQANP